MIKQIERFCKATLCELFFLCTCLCNLTFVKMLGGNWSEKNKQLDTVKSLAWELYGIKRIGKKKHRLGHMNNFKPDE